VIRGGADPYARTNPESGGVFPPVRRHSRKFMCWNRLSLPAGKESLSLRAVNGRLM